MSWIGILIGWFCIMYWIAYICYKFGRQSALKDWLGTINTTAKLKKEKAINDQLRDFMTFYNDTDMVSAKCIKEILKGKW